jgi:hypothetical protein
VLDGLEAIAATRAIRVCAVDLPMPPCPWLTPIAPPSGALALYRSMPPGLRAAEARPPSGT